MSDSLFKQLPTVPLLKRAWHLARQDARDNFLYDSLRYSDFAFRLDDYVKALSEDLRRGTYHPKRLQLIDIPKSSLSVRPGTALGIEDHIVLFAITLLIAPPLDRRLPENVYSWRLKKKIGKKELFRDNEILRFPFLRSETIKKHIEVVEPWYGVWPRFTEDTRLVYEKEGYNYIKPFHNLNIYRF